MYKWRGFGFFIISTKTYAKMPGEMFPFDDNTYHFEGCIFSQLLNNYSDDPHTKQAQGEGKDQ